MPTSHPPRDAVVAGRRGYAAALLLGLLGSLAVVVGTARPWAWAEASPPGLPAIHVFVTGTDLEPACGALGLAVLAAFGAVIATRGWVRRGIGAAVVAGAVAVLVLAATTPADPTPALVAELSAKGWTGGAFASGTQVWRWVVVAGGVAAMVAGAAVARFGSAWASMGARYDAPVADRSAEDAEPARDLTETEAWKAIDQGRDPTQTG